MTCAPRDEIKMFQVSSFSSLRSSKKTETQHSAAIEDSCSKTREIIVFHDLSGPRLKWYTYSGALSRILLYARELYESDARGLHGGARVA